ncbi:unnamed protein product [Lepeophtheirus salmonis]|uniref:(salmon louse) hypothetical protein n=1 Tax=Lepeophtheirus salmonis TaxID=72036 RepID=A0A7R8CF86_LEPSM|nr:unnamed protein product [Lepeophtheirus salmonis]CAF2803953.1 unnamed protein product [Lepeophtheirus salmonis]
MRQLELREYLADGGDQADFGFGSEEEGTIERRVHSRSTPSEAYSFGLASTKTVECGPVPASNVRPLKSLAIQSMCSFLSMESENPYSLSSSQLVYGFTLRPPRQFLSKHSMPNPCTPQDLYFRVSEKMEAIKPVKLSQPKNPNLSKSTMSMESENPYNYCMKDLFAVICCTRKTITIDRKGRKDRVSVDRVKPAYLINP